MGSLWVNSWIAREAFNSKMAAVIRTCSPQFRQFYGLLSPSAIITRTLASQRSAVAFEGQRKQDDNVYLLNHRPPPSHTFNEALDVLRAYAISKLDETLELHLKINMGEKKVIIVINTRILAKLLVQVQLCHQLSII